MERVSNSKTKALGESKNSNNAAVKMEKLRGALKAFIIKERQRKKEEFEAKIEEERLRKECEARERQNDMTLEETRSQITKLDQKLTDLRNQKQQLFSQLKKVLYEDEARKKQQKDSEMYALQQANVVPQQIYMPPVRLQHHQMPILPKPSGKRGHRSPSPTTQQGYYNNSNYTQPKHDEGRRATDYARVLWNKPPTSYQNRGTLFYQTTSNAPPPQPPPDARNATIIYNAYNLPLRQGFHLELQPGTAVSATKSDAQAQKPAQVYHINIDQPPISQASGPPGIQSKQVTMEKINDRYVEVKHDGSSGHGPQHLPEGMVFAPMIPGMPLHPSVMQITGQAPKSSSGFATASAHEQLARQQQLSAMQGQPGQQPHYRYHI